MRNFQTLTFDLTLRKEAGVQAWLGLMCWKLAASFVEAIPAVIGQEKEEVHSRQVTEPNTERQTTILNHICTYGQDHQLTQHVFELSGEAE